MLSILLPTLTILHVNLPALLPSATATTLADTASP
jgi:hypothetical protein